MIPRSAAAWGTALFILLSAAGTAASDLPQEIHLTRDWEMRSATRVEEAGAKVSSPEYVPKDWFAAEIPTTVLNALVRNGIYPDPYVGLNNMRIPDACEEFNQKHGLGRFSHLPGKRNPWLDPYWFRTRFTLPEEYNSRRVWLRLRGINYRAEVWVNGRRIAGADEIVGMFGDWAFDVSAFARPGALNGLAIKVFPLDVPGIPGEPQLETFGSFGLNGGETGDIGVNVTMQASVGWDWLPAVRDRNMGIWQGVSVIATGSVDVRDPRVITDLPLPNLDRASLKVSADLVNTNAAPHSGSLKLRITSPDPEVPALILEQPVNLEPGESRPIEFDPSDFPDLLLPNPRLWWPNGLGEPELYGLEIRFESKGGEISDRAVLKFGIREVSSALTEVEGWVRRDFSLNGHKLRLRGGAWVPDMMLNRSSEKLHQELSLCRHANLNLIRIWGGGVTPPDEFFSICDELGLLVWHDFWITGDCQGTWGKGSQAYPFEADVFLDNASDTVRRLRSHPCLLVWTAGNEGYPREEIYVPLRDRIVAGLDGTRPFIPSSGYREPPEEWGLAWPDNGKAGTYSGGPYNWVDPRIYFEKADAGQDWLFKNEVGIPSVPVLESLRRFIPDLTPDEELAFPLNHVWGYHDACEGNGKSSLYDLAIRSRYGEPADLADYVFKAQLVNAESYRAMFEAVNQVGDRSAGILLWKVNPAWPSVVWQLYDWYLSPHAGYYAAKKACEPLHIQLNPTDGKVVVINNGLAEFRGLAAEAEVFAASGSRIWGLSESLDLGSGDVRELFSVPLPEGREAGVLFVRLWLQDRAGEVLSDSVTWLAAEGDYSGLQGLPDARLECEVVRVVDRADLRTCVFRLYNPGPALAFFLRARVVEGQGGPEILPSFWSDNYFSLTPGTSRTLSVEFPRSAAQGQPGELFLSLSGANVAPLTVRIPVR